MGEEKTYVGEENTQAFVDYVLSEYERTEFVHQHVSSPELEETFPKLSTHGNQFCSINFQTSHEPDTTFPELVNIMS